MSNHNVKETIGKYAADMVREGMVVGLGTGSTAACFIDALIERCRHGLEIKTVSTSEASKRQAEKGGITVVELENIEKIDITFDGADNVDSQKRLVKGLGGALLREKIVAATSEEMVVLVEERKITPVFADLILPVAITPYGFTHTIQHLKEQGFEGKIRQNEEGGFFVSDDGNYMFDITFSGELRQPEAIDYQIRNVVGVVETGFFFGLATSLLVGYEDGRCEVLQ